MESSSAPTLQTSRLLLRPWQATDRAEYKRICHVSADLWRPWMPATDPGESPDEMFDRVLELSTRGVQAGTQYRAVGVLDDGRIAGIFSLSEIVRGVFLCGYAGWRVSADVVRQGYATEGVRGILDLAFAPTPHGLGLHRVQANVIPTNMPSLRVAEKCGFRREGHAVRYLKIAGQWQDHVMFAKLVDEHEFNYLHFGPANPSPTASMHQPR